MLMLNVYLHDILYAVACRQIREIVPMVHLKTIPRAPAFFAGFFNYRSTIVPAIDLCRYLEDQPCRIRLSTRMLLVDYEKRNGTPAITAFLAERVTEIIRIPPENFISPDIHAPGSDFLGNFILNNEKMTPCIDIVKLADSIDLLHNFENEGEHDIQRD
jgi:chemotaxis-related protein WspB